MNDCFWCCVEGACEWNNCHDCQSYISLNSDEGIELFDKYQADVHESLKSVYEKWSKIREETDHV